MVVSSNVRLAIRAAFVELLAAQERLGILEDIAKRRRDNLMLVTLNYGAGKEHIGSLLLAQADLEQAKFEIEEAKRNIYASQTRLIKRLGRMKITPVKVQGDFSIAHPERERPNLDSLAESNPFLKEVISKKDAARFGIKSAKADFFPKVYADASRQRDHIGNPRDNTDNWMFGATFSLPVFDGGLRMAEVSKAKALFSQLEADERGGRDNVIVTLDETWKKFQDAIDEVSVRKSYLHAAEERAKITKTQYSLGLISFDNWIIIEEELVRAKKAFLDIQATVLLREAEWIQAKGGTLDYEN
jgi:outer membrane protein TolC